MWNCPIHFLCVSKPCGLSFWCLSVKVLRGRSVLRSLTHVHSVIDEREEVWEWQKEIERKQPNNKLWIITIVLKTDIQKWLYWWFIYLWVWGASGSQGALLWHHWKGKGTGWINACLLLLFRLLLFLIYLAVRPPSKLWKNLNK